MLNTTFLSRARAGLAALALLAAPWLAGTALAQDDPPGRVARLAAAQGAVSWFDHEQGQWAEAQRNRPLTSGDRLSTGAAATAELRVGSTVLRLSEGSEIEWMRIDDERIALQLHRGSLALHVRSREVADEIDLVTAEAMLRPLRSGLYRLDRIDDSTHATTLRGALRVDERDGFTIEAGQRAELWREGAGVLRSRLGTAANDAFAAWIASEDRREEHSASSRYVSPEMTGAEELDRNGRWEQHPEHGALWVPLAVAADWAPYRYGHWAWVRPWGWTWVDDAPWGFAPFHYGRWVHWRGRWGWTPGAYVARPVYAPALVAWIGGARLGVSIQIGGPAVSWVPLAPREPFRPYYRATPRYEDRVNHRPHQAERPGRPAPPPQQQRQPHAPLTYGNARAPGAVTTVPREVMVHRQPVARAAIDSRDVMRGGTPLMRAVPPLRELAPPLQMQVPPPTGPSPHAQGPRPMPAPAPAAAPDNARKPAPPAAQRPVHQAPAVKEPPKQPANPPARPPAPAAAPAAVSRAAPHDAPPVAPRAALPVAPPVAPPAAPPAAPAAASPSPPPAQAPAATPPQKRIPEGERRRDRDGQRKTENLQ